MDEIIRDFDEDSPEVMIGKLRESFRDEAYELLGELESALLELENNPTDAELISRVFRALHTVKGSGSVCDLTDIAEFAHEVETFFDAVRKRNVTLTQEGIDLTLKARDHIKALLDTHYKGEKTAAGHGEEIIASFKALISVGEEGQPSAPPVSSHDGSPVPRQEPQERSVTYRIRFRPGYDIFHRGIDPARLLGDLCRLGACKVVAQTDAIPLLENLDPDKCYTYWESILTTNRGIEAIEDVFIFVRDTSDLSIEVIDEDGLMDLDEGMYKKLGEILLDRGDLTREDLQKVLHSHKRIGEVLIESGIVSGDKVASALVEQEHVRELRQKRQTDDLSSSIRVSTHKLDSLVNLVGELVTVQSRLSQMALHQNTPEIVSISQEVERLTSELRDSTMSIRMVPIGTLFSKLKRLVRDVSSELGKEVDLTIHGADTELDKTIIERLSDPLVHLIRNSISHGIEKPAVRKASGKPRKGMISLSAAHAGAQVIIRVTDDGTGIDAEQIRLRAEEKGMIKADAELSEKETLALVFIPGFSTASHVTRISGRGVGMDVVKKAIEGLRGTIEIDTQKGIGTMITLKLPLTLAIIEGFMTRIGSERFIFPLEIVEECIELLSGNGNTVVRDLANVRGEMVPFIRLRKHFGIGGPRAAVEQIVITKVDGRRVGFVVDHVIGTHQTVIKSLGSLYQGHVGISGASILGDGSVALILDVPKLIQTAEREEKAAGRTDRTDGPPWIEPSTANRTETEPL